MGDSIMEEHLFESFPFAIFQLNQNSECIRMNKKAKKLLSILDLKFIKLLLKDENLVNIPYWPSPSSPILYFKIFKLGGTQELLVLVGENPDFWKNSPPILEQRTEDFPSDPEEISQKIASLVSETMTFQRFDLLRVERSLRKYTYEFSIGAELVGNPHTAYLTIGNTGLGWIFKEELPYLVEELAPDHFRFSEDPLLYENGYRSILRVPILFEHGIVGALMLANTEPGKFTISDALLMHQLASLVAQPFFHAGIQLKQHHSMLIGATLLHSVIDNITEENISRFLANYCERLSHTVGMERVSVFVFNQSQKQRRYIAEAGEELQGKPESLKQWSSIKNTGIDQMLEKKSIISFNLGDPSLVNVDYLVKRGFTSIIYSPIEDEEGNIIACLAGASSDERALSPSIAGLFKNASEQLSLILSKLTLQTLTNTALKKNSITRNVPKGFEAIIGSSEVMRETIYKASLAAKYDFPILITGETGTGKELFAKAIHQSSSVSNGPYITVNSAAIPANLLESELFGYQEGAFTGGLKGGKLGKVQLADGGTLFLDEIGDLSQDLQAKLLRVIQEKEVEPLGSTKPIPVNVRFISATNRNLNEMIQEGIFREDLLYRVNTIEITLPPLREREKDVLELAESMLTFLSTSHGVPLKKFSNEAKELLSNYSWPGNVRQLQNVINRLFVFSEGNTIQISDFPMDIRSNPTPQVETEQEKMKRLLEEFNGNKTALADYLGISRTGLWKKLRRLDLQ